MQNVAAFQGSEDGSLSKCGQKKTKSSERYGKRQEITVFTQTMCANQEALLFHLKEPRVHFRKSWAAWMDGWVGVVKAFAAVAVPSCIRQWPEQLLQAVNGLIEVENLD